MATTTIIIIIQTAPTTPQTTTPTTPTNTNFQIQISNRTLHQIGWKLFFQKSKTTFSTPTIKTLNHYPPTTLSARKFLTVFRREFVKDF